MISSDIMRGYNDILILYLLLEEDSYGYAISKRISEISEGIYDIKETTLYSSINRLEKNGYIDSYIGEVTKGRERTYFTITRAGREYYVQKCDEWESTKLLIDRFTGKQRCSL